MPGGLLGKLEETNIFQHMTTPKQNDNLNTLERRKQVTLFRLRTQHIPLNFHLNRIQPEREPLCSLCPHPYETVPHILFDCPALNNLLSRPTFLPTTPNIRNTLYRETEQQEKTYRFFVMATGRRAQAHKTAGSEK